MKRKVLIGLLATVLVVSLISCAGPWQRKAVSAYELAGMLPSMVCNTAQDNCKSATPTISAVKCIQLQKICTDGKKVYAVAGVSLDTAMKTSDAISQNTFLQDYNKLMLLYGDLSRQILQIGIDLKLIK